MYGTEILQCVRRFAPAGEGPDDAAGSGDSAGGAAPSEAPVALPVAALNDEQQRAMRAAAQGENLFITGA